MINVIIADDQKIVREGLKMILSLDNEIKVIGEVDNGQDLIELLKKNIYPDVILMDIRMPILNHYATSSSKLSNVSTSCDTL